MTDRYYDIEEVVDKVIEVLEAELPAAITQINTEKGDLPLSNPEKYTFGSRVIDPNIMKGKSTVEVLAESEVGLEFNQGETDQEVYLDVNLIAWEEVPETVERKILRYARALRKVIDDNSFTKIIIPKPDNVKDSVVGELRYGLMMLLGDIYSKTVTVRFRLRTIYTYE